MTAGRERV